MKDGPSDNAIRTGEVYRAREAARRLGWGRKTFQRAQKDGLKTVLYGREKYVTGRAVVEFFERLESNGQPGEVRGEGEGNGR